MKLTVQNILARCERKSNGCLEWTGAISGNGYAHAWEDGTGKTIPLHKLLYELVHGHIPKGLQACHTCDNSKCVDPDHIFVGSPNDNHTDMISKGRSRIPKSKLTTEIVKEIKLKLQQGYNLDQIANNHGVSSSTIKSIKYGYSWKHVRTEWLGSKI